MRRKDDRPNVFFNGRIARVSDKAVMVQLIGSSGLVSDEFWIPKSQIVQPRIEEKDRGSDLDMEISAWIAGEKGIT